MWHSRTAMDRQDRHAISNLVPTGETPPDLVPAVLDVTLTGQLQHNQLPPSIRTTAVTVARVYRPDTALSARRTTLSNVNPCIRAIVTDDDSSGLVVSSVATGSCTLSRA